MSPELKQYIGKCDICLAHHIYIKVSCLTTVTSKAVIKALKEIFARLGIPDEEVSDNGPQFSSAEFEVFTKTWSFSHVISSPTHGQSDGKVQSPVKTVKRLFTKCQESGHSEHLALLDWRNTPSESAQAQHST
ncbi:Endogenous retrovirus group K member 19 Pol protein [Acropora cervicornis]|uniref:Endogenous retrovirus group K member 19 Pol protein n=1 Tax=Acropora cervicornis TaxID=6130 RepID=A0AAD9PUW2_ACRCE|nr:Endogenous retrovirus group K member 19 Pol protein [Acropora cervicornis]